MFQVIEKTELFNARGNVVSSSTRVIYQNESVLDCARLRYVIDPLGGHSVSLTHRKSVTLSTLRDGERFEFSEMFRLVEGQDAYDAVDSGAAPPVSEREWVLSKAVA